MEISTPYFYVDESLLIKNLEILRGVIERTGCKILLAQKAFSMYSLYPLISRYLHGTCASGLFEARLAHEHFGGENHVYAPAFDPRDFDELLKYGDHFVFNSFAQWETFGARARAAGKICGIRVNPECSTQDSSIYNPCAPGSRMGVTEAAFEPDRLEGITGLHFHTLCEQNSDALEETALAVERKFGKYLPSLDWINFGGGHHITRPDYDIGRLERVILGFKEKYGLEVYLEPGEAVVLNTGFLVASVLDFVENGVTNAILDTSAACHMPDVLEMPYRPLVQNAGLPGEKRHTYRLGGPTCLAGDIIGDYSFDHELRRGEHVVFCDMAHYTMVKTNTFNGLNLPSVAIKKETGELSPVRTFGYGDFKTRL